MLLSHGDPHTPASGRPWAVGFAAGDPDPVVSVDADLEFTAIGSQQSADDAVGHRLIDESTVAEQQQIEPVGVVGIIKDRLSNRSVTKPPASIETSSFVSAMGRTV